MAGESPTETRRRTDRSGRISGTRRTFLAACSVGVFGFGAGCIGDDGSGTNDTAPADGPAHASEDDPAGTSSDGCDPEEMTFGLLYYSAVGVEDDLAECLVPAGAAVAETAGMAGGSVEVDYQHPGGSRDAYELEDITLHDGSDSDGTPTVQGVLDSIRDSESETFTETTDSYAFETEGTQVIATSTDPYPEKTFVAYPHPMGVVSLLIPGVDSACPRTSRRVYGRLVSSHRPK